MTLLPIQNALIQVLTQKDTITAADFHCFALPEDQEPYREQLARTVLADLATAGMLRGVAAAGETESSLWVLTSPLGSAGQEVSISLSTAIEVADEINAFRDAFSETGWPEVNALNLGEPHVLMLLGIISQLRGEDPDAGHDGGGAE